jgi:hypothetical protein
MSPLQRIPSPAACRRPCRPRLPCCRPGFADEPVKLKFTLDWRFEGRGAFLLAKSKATSLPKAWT